MPKKPAPKVVQLVLPPPPQTPWEHVKAFFKYSHAIFLARLTFLVGFALAVIGSLDWSPLLSLDIDTGFSKNQVVWLGIVTIFKGILDEVARRYNAKTLP